MYPSGQAIDGEPQRPHNKWIGAFSSGNILAMGDYIGVTVFKN